MRRVEATIGFAGITLVSIAAAQTVDTPAQKRVPLAIPAGVPLRLYLAKRAPKREGAPVEAKVLDPAYAFDREVVPAGATVLGRVVHVNPVSKGQRVRAILGGDFTPLHTAYIEFNTVVMPDGRQLPLKTAESPGLDSLVSTNTRKRQGANSQQNAGVLGTAKQKTKDAIQGQIDRAKSIPDLVRGADKKEKLEDYLLAKLPYHPQYLRKGTRFDAELAEPLSFGSESLRPESLAEAGAQPPAGSVARARLVTALDSKSSKPGEPVEAVLAEPVFSSEHKLILPEGTLVEGTVVEARPARWFHRGGRLRFTFKEVQLPEEMMALRESAPAPADSVSGEPHPQLKFRTEANLNAAESDAKSPLKIDSEGGVQTKESKTRFLAAAAAVIVARSAGDNDPIRNSSHQVIGQSQNVGGRTVGGGFGFGLLGIGIAQSSRWVGAAFGYYGMAWSVFSTVIARGAEIRFGKDAMMDIRFDTRTEKAATPGAPPK